MYQKPSVPRPIGGVLDDTFRLYKESFSSCWLPALFMTLVASATSYYRFSAAPPLRAGASLRDMLLQYQVTPRGYQLASLLLILVEFVIYGVLFINIVAVSRGETPKLGASLAKALRRTPALIVAAIIFLVAVAVGTVLLIIPGVYIWNRLQLFVVPLVTDPQGPGEALGTSWRLVKGNWWRTATLLFVMFVIMYVLGMVLLALGGAIVAVTGGGPTSIVQGAGEFIMGSILLGGIVGVFTTPLFVTVFVALYQDLLLRKGGADLEARLGALPKG